MSSREIDENEYTFEGDELIEVDVDDTAPPESDTESVWTDAVDDDIMAAEEDEGMMDADEDPAIDLAYGTFLGHGKESVYCVAVLPQNPCVVITGGGDDCAYIWSYENPVNSDGDTKSIVTVLHSLKGHTDSVTSVGFNFDGTLALTGSYDGTVRIWSVADGTMKLVLDGPEDIDWAEWHSKGNAVIAGSKDGTVWMWLAHNGQCVQVFAGHDGGVSSGCFTNDGKMVCTGGEDGTIRVWAPKSGQCKITFDGPHAGHEGTVTCLQSSLDGDLLLSGSIDGKVRLFQISGKKVLQTFIHCSPQSIRDDKAAATLAAKQAAYQNGDIDADDDDLGLDVDVEATLSVECVGFCNNSDLKWIASGGMDNCLKVWDMVSGTCRTSCNHGGSVVALKWHSKLPIIATAALDNDLRVWDARNGSLLALLSGHNDLILSLDFKPYPGSESAGSRFTDVIVTVSDDCTSKVFPINSYTLGQST